LYTWWRSRAHLLTESLEKLLEVSSSGELVPFEVPNTFHDHSNKKLAMPARHPRRKIWPEAGVTFVQREELRRWNLSTKRNEGPLGGQ
jgi:hypothetical protein